MSDESSPQLRITVTDTSTVFTGAANLHRFDAPSEHEIAVFVRNVFGPHPEGAHVHVTASRPRLERIEAALGDYDVALSTESLPELPDDGVDDEGFDVDEDAWDEPQRSTVVVGAAVGIVVVLVASATVILARWFMAADAPGPPAETVAVEVEETEEDGVGEAGVDKQLPPTPQTVTLEETGVRVDLPEGFTAGEVDGSWRATGLDPDFRLHIAVEELYNLPAQAMVEQVLADIEADPETELVSVDGHALTYRELPGDGSEVLWKTWSQDNYQVFVACHTRTAPTKVQTATCKMAMESAKFRPQKRDDLRVPS